MKIYISGISGTGMGPLALMAADAGFAVAGSDLQVGAIAPELEKRGIKVQFGPQDGNFLKESRPDWFVYTSALPEDHPELVLAKELGLKISKRDEFLNFLLEKLGLKLVAVAGTHGKTTTSAMIVWGAQQLGLPLSYNIGTTLPFAPAGHYNSESEFFVYEADEYDRNFLAFRPWLAAITNVTYDHPDIYKTPADYRQAFEQFKNQSQQVIEARGIDSKSILNQKNSLEPTPGQEISPKLTLAGEIRRLDATLAMQVLEKMSPGVNRAQLVQILNNFPGVGRRFERLEDGFYSDYAHHPEEVESTIAMAKEEAAQKGFKGVVAIYQPHQNSRQVELMKDYPAVFKGLDKLYWLPTYLTRENPELAVIAPAEFIAQLENPEIAEPTDLNAELAAKIRAWHKKGYLILLMTAGPADTWFRQIVQEGD